MKDFAAINFETANQQRTSVMLGGHCDSEGWRDCRQLLQPHQARTGIDAEACAWHSKRAVIVSTRTA